MFEEYEKEKHEKAYARGVENAKNQDLIGGFCHELGDIIVGGIPGETSEHKSEEAGYHDYMNGKTE